MKHESQGKYRFVVVPGHPMADSRGRILEHRYVMACKLGRSLTSDEVVHHINHDKRNNRPENLEILSNTAHSRLHHGTTPISLVCPQCLQTFERSPRIVKSRRKTHKLSF